MKPTGGRAARLAALVVAIGDARVPVRGVLIGIVALVAVVEGLWRLAYGQGSPAVAAVLVPLAWGAGRALERLSAGSRGTWSHAESIVGGVVVLGAAYLVLTHFHVVRPLFVPVAVIVAAVGARPRVRPLLRRSVRVHSLLLAAFAVLLAVRAAWFIDRLPLTRPHPPEFAWVDTSFWLSVAYAVERGCPAPDPLFHGAILNYHFGCGVPIAMIRALTGLPMHVAYFATLVGALLLVPPLLLRVCRVLLRVPVSRVALLAWPVVLIGVGSARYFLWAFPTAIAMPLLVFVVLRVATLRAWREGLPIAAGFAALILTKEVHYVLAACLGLVAALHALLTRRSATVAVVVGISLAASRPLHAFLVRVDQKAVLGPYHEHLSFDWLVDDAVREANMFQAPGSVHEWQAAGALALVWALTRAARPREMRLPWILGAVLATHAAGFALSVAVKPRFIPEMDPFSYRGALFDMAQFEANARLVLLATLLLVASSEWLRRAEGPRGRRIVAAVSAVGTLFVLLQLSKPPPAPQADPVVPLLEVIDPRTSIIASDELGWNFENANWAGYMGHQFFQLRRIRWATAVPGFEKAVARQKELLTTESREVAMEIVRERHITHVLTARDRVAPWLKGVPPTAENERYVVHDVRSLTTPR